MDTAGGYSLPQGLRAVVGETDGCITRCFRFALQKQYVAIVGIASALDSLVSLALIERPDLVITHLPLGEDGSGVEALETLASVPASLLVIAGSGGGVARHRLEAVGLGVVIDGPLNAASLSKGIAETYARFRPLPASPPAAPADLLLPKPSRLAQRQAASTLGVGAPCTSSGSKQRTVK